MKQNSKESLRFFEKVILDQLEWFRRNADLDSIEVLNCRVMFLNSLFILRTFIDKKDVSVSIREVDNIY